MGSSRVTAADQGRTQFIELMARYCQLGRLLPAIEDIDTPMTMQLRRRLDAAANAVSRRVLESQTTEP
jgi:hypothetical protein